jgi:two-component system NtrC family sensor kinase
VKPASFNDSLTDPAASPNSESMQSPSAAVTLSPASESRGNWVYRLLEMSLSLPFDAGVEAVVSTVSEHVALMAPSCWVGAHVVASDPIRTLTVVKGPPAPRHARHPTRLFPFAATECAVALEIEPSGSALHVASNEAARLQPGGDVDALVRLASRVLSSAIAQARQLRELREGHAELRRLHAHVIQAEKLASLGQLVAGVVHELNNPLTSILAYSDFLLRKGESAGTDPEDLERLRRIGEAATRMQTFSKDLVTYARPATGTPEVVHLQDVLCSALVFCEHEFDKQGISVHRHFASGLPPVRAIARQLTQVLVNLFINAAHAMEGGGTLTLSLFAEPHQKLSLQINDTGTGIAEADLPRVFEPFFTTKPQGRGAGLGLSIVKDIVGAHGGALTVESTVGEGTTFTLTLPTIDGSLPSLAP